MAGHAGTFLLLHFPGIVLGGREIGESRESGEQEGARANKRNDIILQAKGKTEMKLETEEEQQERGLGRGAMSVVWAIHMPSK